jgi:hypothetical protein
MRTVIVIGTFALVLLAVGCGPKRHVVIPPEDVAGRKGDTWHVTGEPQPPPHDPVPPSH